MGYVTLYSLTVSYVLANPAYQNMLKSTEMSSTLGSKNLEDILDDHDSELEKIVSPKAKLSQ